MSALVGCYQQQNGNTPTLPQDTQTLMVPASFAYWYSTELYTSNLSTLEVYSPNGNQIIDEDFYLTGCITDPLKHPLARFTVVFETYQQFAGLAALPDAGNLIRANVQWAYSTEYNSYACMFKGGGVVLPNTVGIPTPCDAFMMVIPVVTDPSADKEGVGYVDKSLDVLDSNFRKHLLFPDKVSYEPGRISNKDSQAIRSGLIPTTIDEEKLSNIQYDLNKAENNK